MNVSAAREIARNCALQSKLSLDRQNDWNEWWCWIRNFEPDPDARDRSPAGQAALPEAIAKQFAARQVMVVCAVSSEPSFAGIFPVNREFTGKSLKNCRLSASCAPNSAAHSVA